MTLNSVQRSRHDIHANTINAAPQHDVAAGHYQPLKGPPCSGARSPHRQCCFAANARVRRRRLKSDMDKFDRIYQLDSILANRRTAIDPETLMARLECSRSTLFRLIGSMKNHLGAPIEFDAEAGGFHYIRTPGTATYHLPGLWFSAAELQCLAVLQRLLADLGGGLLQEQVTAIGKRLSQLIAHRRLNLTEATSRIRFPTIAARPAGEAFQIAASATLQRKKLWFEYHSRGNNRHSERAVSPQRLVHYRDAWYLDAHDDDSGKLRTFSIERVKRPKVLSSRARDFSESELNDYFTSGYGIFGGKPDKTAVLHFTSERARWVAEEEWHPTQHGTFLPDGTYELRIPYQDPRELVMDILRHGPHVRVIEPQPLRDEVKRQFTEALARY